MMYQLPSKQLSTKAKPIQRIAPGSPMYRFYSSESGYILPGHKVELITGHTVTFPFHQYGEVTSCIRKNKAQYLRIENYTIEAGTTAPLILTVKNISNEAICIQYGEPVGMLIIKSRVKV